MLIPQDKVSSRYSVTLPLSLLEFCQIGCLTSIILAFDFLLLSNLLPTQAKPSENQENSTSAHYQGLPANRRDGGSRGNCITNGKDFVALVPDRSVNVTSSIASGLFFYVPQTETPKTIEFVIRTKEEDRLVHEAFVQTTGQAGIMSVAIPEYVQENIRSTYGDYRWYLSMICDPNQRSRDLVLEGWIEYVELDASVKHRINTSSLVEKSNLLQQEGVWYDALSILGEQKALDSETILIQAEWAKLLESIGLTELATEPLLKTETIDNFYPISPKEY